MKLELEQVDLTKSIEEVVKVMVGSKMGVRELNLFVEISVILHQKYEKFAGPLVAHLAKQYKNVGPQEFNRRRNILKAMSELFLKGLISDYREVFKCIYQLL